MDFSDWKIFIVPTVFVGFLGWRFMRFRLAKKRIPSWLARGAVIVDVRTPAQIAAGASLRAINIPLGELEKNISRLDPKKPIIICRAAGTRAAMAAMMLRRHGFKEVLNAGSWTNTLEAS